MLLLAFIAMVGKRLGVSFCWLYLGMSFVTVVVVSWSWLYRGRGFCIGFVHFIADLRGLLDSDSGDCSPTSDNLYTFFT